jgi:hypothetical protein
MAEGQIEINWELMVRQVNEILPPEDKLTDHAIRVLALVVKNAAEAGMHGGINGTFQALDGAIKAI